MNVLVVMKHRGDAGNTHAVANYMRLAPRHGHTVAIFGTPIWYVPELQFSTDIGTFDRVMYVYEFGALPHPKDERGGHPRQISAGPPADHGHRRHVQSRGHDRRLRLQSCERGRAGALDRSPRCARRQGHADHHRRAHPAARAGHDVLRVQSGSAARPVHISRPSSTTSSISATTGGAGERFPASCCRRSRRSATRSAASPSSAFGGTRLRPRDPQPGPRKRSRPTLTGSAGCGSRHRRR